MSASHRASPPAFHARALVLGGLALAIAAPAAATSTMDVVNQVDRDSYHHFMWDLLYTHPGDDRGFGPEHDLARANIFAELESYGLDVTLHPFEVWGETWYNVVAVKPGVVTPEQQYLVGSHYDSVDNPGADDNASGVAGFMEIARVLSQYEFESTLVFVAFDREEQGLYGSQAYAEEHQNDDIRGMISMDMIAYNTGANSVDIIGRTASNPIKNALALAVEQYGAGLVYDIRGQADYSNHAPFEWFGFEACLIIEDWGNPYYHTQDDHVEMPNYLDFDYATRVTRAVCGWMADQAVLVEAVACPEDLDTSGAVDFGDILAILAGWGPCSGCPEDLDGSGAVDFGDILAVLSAWGPCP